MSDSERWVPREISIVPLIREGQGNDLLYTMAGFYGDPIKDEDDFHEWVDVADDETLIAALLGWHLRALNVSTGLDFDLAASLVFHRQHVRSGGTIPDSAEELARLGVEGDVMLPGFLVSNAGIEEDTLARIYLRVIRVHDFLQRFGQRDEVDGVFDPHGVRHALSITRDELLVDAANWLWLHQPDEDDGRVNELEPYPHMVEQRIADEAESIRRRFGCATEAVAEHPYETHLRVRLGALQARYAAPKNTPFERFRRKHEWACTDTFWTPARVQAAFDLGLEK